MKNVIVILIACWSLSGCSDFLEPQSQSEYVPETIAALNEMLIGSAYPQAGGEDIMGILSVLDDDIACTDSAGGVINATNERTFAMTELLFGWQPNFWVEAEKLVAGFSVIPNYWENFYAYILGANAALDYADKVDGTNEERALVKAQAYALRAFYYFHLVNMFGKPYNADKTSLGVPLKLSSDMEDKDLARNTVEEVYDQIISDLSVAEELYESLPQELQFKRDYRTSLPMVQLLKSRVYLYMEDWKNAEAYAKKVIDNPEFVLIDFNTLPAASEKEPYYNFVSLETSTECIWCYGSIYEAIQFVDISLSVPSPTNLMDYVYDYNFFNASPELLSGYVEGDLRKERYILKGRIREKISDYEYTYRWDGYYPYGKFSITSDYGANRGNSFAYAFRLAEAYLNLAEAACKDGDTETALDALNTLRQHRFLTSDYEKIQGMEGDELLDMIRQERRLELCFEGHRWYDLRRYGMPSFYHVWKVGGVPQKTYTLLENDPGYTLPIPQVVLEQNRELVQNEFPAQR